MALEKKDYGTATSIFAKLANGGDLTSQLYLAHIYENGLGTSKDLSMAFAWYQKAAEQGQAIAQFNLGFFYKEGLGTAVNHQQAIYWYKKSAQQGNVYALHNLGYMHEQGLGVEKNLLLALDFYEQAASKDNIVSWLNVAELLNNPNLGSKYDANQALNSYKKALVHKDKLRPSQVQLVENKISTLEKVLPNITPVKASEEPTPLKDTLPPTQQSAFKSAIDSSCFKPDAHAIQYQVKKARKKGDFIYIVSKATETISICLSDHQGHTLGLNLEPKQSYTFTGMAPFYLHTSQSHLVNIYFQGNLIKLKPEETAINLTLKDSPMSQQTQ